MSEDETRLSAAGWTLAIGAASGPGNPRDNPEFHAIYSGVDFGNLQRGLVAAVARGSGAGKVAREAAELAVHQLVEGYFGAAATLGAGRAASLALSSLNGWMFSQSRADPERTNMSASLSALIFVGRHVSIIHIGDCRIYRKRGDQLAPLTAEHVKLLPDGSSALSRAVGGDAEISAEYAEDAPEAADRYIILSKGAYAAPSSAEFDELLMTEAAAEATAVKIVDAAITGDPKHGGATAVVIDVLTLPEANLDDLAAAFAQLPLRKPPRAGENWDGFIIGRTLYHSRYTTLKLAHDTVSDREVVLKIPLPFMLQDQVFRAGFLREAWVGTTVHSRWVARYIDIPAERRSSLYLVMPHYRGETLEQRLLRPPPIAYLDGIAIALKLCAAVQDLAALQIIHRDLKPDNVILLRDGEVRLLDLGLAYLPGIDEPDDDRLGGTTRYMAPELFRGAAADQRSEVFSLGVTVYRLFASGAFPFGQREALPLARLRPDLPAWLGHCLQRAIDLDPDKRFQHAGELASALQNGMSRDNAVPLPRISWRQWLGAARLWQGLTLLFAAGFFVLLILLLSGRRI
jgi:serine/threonine protein phosphatase PrpC